MAIKAPVDTKTIPNDISDKAFIVADKAAASAEAAYAAASEKVKEAIKPAAKAVAAVPAKISAVAKTAVKTANATKPAKVAKLATAKTVKAAKSSVAKVKTVKAVDAKFVKTTFTKGTKTMTDTVKNYAEAAKAQFETMFGDNFGDMGTKAKDMMAQGQKVAGDVVEFSKGNLEAVVASGKITAKGVEVMARDSYDYGRKSLEETTAAIKTMTTVKSPTEFMTLNTELSKKAFDSAVAQASKQSELMVKLANDAFAPISNRFSIAMTKFKNAA